MAYERRTHCWVKTVRDGAQMPKAQHDGDAGSDLYVVGDHDLPPGHGVVYIPIGIAVQPDRGYWFRITHRSSTVDRGIEVIEGTIDNGFRGELFTRVRNLTPDTIHIGHGERISQMVAHRVVTVEFEQTDELAESARGANGFGSTGR